MQEFVNYAAGYMAVGYVLMLIPFVRNTLSWERAIVVTLWFWPVALLLILSVVCVEALPYRFALESHQRKELRTWGTRKSDIYSKSFAIRCPWVELQIWKVK